MWPEVTKQPLIYALIPARGGSKSIRLKNIRTVNGIPLLAHSIETAQKTRVIQKVFVSTDHRLIADVSRRFGAIVPFIRPPEISQDNTRDFAVLKHFAQWVLNSDYEVPDLICFLRPTYPFRDPVTVELALKSLWTTDNASGLRSVCLADQTPYKMWQIETDGFAKPIVSLSCDEDASNAPRQELPPVYWQDGYVDCLRFENLLKEEGMLGSQAIIFHSPHAGPDLDYQEDLAALNSEMYGYQYIAETNATPLDKVRMPS